MSLKEGHMRELRLIVLALAVVGGAALFFYGARTMFRAFESDGWPTVEGSVTTSRVDASKGRRAIVYSPHVEYRYAVNGHQYVSDVLSFASLGATGARAQEWTSKYPRGTQVTVHYQPSHPEVACVICARPGWRDVIAPVLGAFIIVAGGAGLIDTVRRRGSGSSKAHHAERPRARTA
jgi:hypothetical protein